MANRSCSLALCAGPAVALGLCDKHYRRLRKHGSTDDPAPRVRPACLVEGCGKPHEALGLCVMHWERMRRHGSLAKPARQRMTDAEWASRKRAAARTYYHSKRGRQRRLERYSERLQYHRAYRASQRERHRAYGRRWYAANREQAAAAGRRWVRENPSAARVNWKIKQERRRALKRNAPAERIVPTEIYQRDGWRCHLCGAPIDPSITEPHDPARVSLDHIIAVNAPDFPGHVWENVAAAHLGCNGAKGDRVSGHDRALHARLAAERWEAATT